MASVTPNPLVFKDGKKAWYADLGLCINEVGSKEASLLVNPLVILLHTGKALAYGYGNAFDYTLV